MIIKQDSQFDYIVSDDVKLTKEYNVVTCYIILRKTKYAFGFFSEYPRLNEENLNAIKEILHIVPTKEQMFLSRYEPYGYKVKGLLNKKGYIALQDDVSYESKLFKFVPGNEIIDIGDNNFLIQTAGYDQTHYTIENGRLFKQKDQLYHFEPTIIPGILCNHHQFYDVKEKQLSKRVYDYISDLEIGIDCKGNPFYYAFANKFITSDIKMYGRNIDTHLTFIVDEKGNIISPIYNSYQNETIIFEDKDDNFEKFCLNTKLDLEKREQNEYSYNKKLLEYVKKKNMGSKNE